LVLIPETSWGDLQPDMISPCRTHQTRRFVDSLPLAFLFAAFLLVPRNEAIGQAGGGGARSVPLDITFGLDFGYDDHVLGSSNTSSTTTSSSGQSSFLVRENVVLTYNRPMERTDLRLQVVGRFDQFVDVGTDDKNLNVTGSLTHNFSTRLSFRADVYAAYDTEPNFQSNVGPENVRAPHLETRDSFSLTYKWLPRFNTVTSYTFDRVLYTQSSSSAATSSNRAQQTLGEQFRFSLTSRTKLTGTYRFETINYDNNPNNNSIIHSALVGVDHQLTEHLRLQVNSGESFLSLENGGASTSPYFQGLLDYKGGNHSLNWITSYGFEAPTTATASTRKTLRTGVNLTYNLTSRLHSTAGVNYHHDDNGGTTSPGTSSAGTQTSLELSLGLRYTINRRFSLHLDFQHTMQGAQQSNPGYSRNRYFLGVNYTY
jgi:Putative beta-barrel porin 2